MLDNALILFYQTLARHVPLKRRYPMVYKAFTEIGLPMSGQQPWTKSQLAVADILYTVTMEYLLFCMIIANPTMTQSLVQLVVGRDSRDSRCMESRLANDWYSQSIIPNIMQTIMNKHYKALKDSGKLYFNVSTLAIVYPAEEDLSVSDLDNYPFFVHDMWLLANKTDVQHQKSLSDDMSLYPRHVAALSSLVEIPRFNSFFRNLFIKFMNALTTLTDWSRAMQDIPGHLTQIAIHVCTVISILSFGVTAIRKKEKDTADVFISLLSSKPELFLMLEKQVMNAYVAQLTTAYDSSTRTTILLQQIKGNEREGRAIRFRLRFHRIAKVEELRDPHIYAFITHHAGAVVSRAPDKNYTMLELMYLRAPGVMHRIGGNRRDNFVEFDLPVGDEDAASRAGDDLRVYFIVMYESTFDKTHTMIPPYQVEAHAHVRVSVLENKRGGRNATPILVPAGCGPIDSTLEFGPDESTRKPFGFIIDSILELQNLSSGAEAGAEPSTYSEEAVSKGINDIVNTENLKLWSQQRLLSGVHAQEHEREINAAIHQQVKAVRAVSKVDQTLAYMGYPMEILGLLAVTYMRGPAISARRFGRAMSNALFAHRMGPQAFIGLVDYLEQDNCNDEWAFTIFKQIACQSLNFANMLIYRGDRLNGLDVDDMRNIRQTGFGDCEDMGECIYKDIETFLAMNDTDFGDDIATLRLKRAIAKHYTPCFTVMYVKYHGSPMHCVASLVPLRKFSAQSAQSDIFKTIMFEGTNPVFPTFISFNLMNCPAMSDQDRGNAQKSVDNAMAVWDIIRKGDHSSGLVQTGFAAPKPPHQYRNGFYKGFVAVCTRIGGKSGYYRFAGMNRDMHPEGEPLNEVLEKDEFTLIDMSEGAAEANAYIEPYNVPCPLYTDAGTDMVLPYSPLMNAAVNKVKQMCLDYSMSAGSRADDGIATKSSFDAKHLCMESVTMSYNMGCADPTRGSNAYDEMIEHLQEIMTSSEFSEKVAKLVPILDEVLPAIHILRIVCFLK